MLVQSLVLTAMLAIPVAPVAALVGTVLGFLVARATTRRNRRVAETVGRWSRASADRARPPRQRKQQVFAISTLVSSSRDLLPDDVPGATETSVHPTIRGGGPRGSITA